MLEKVRSFIEDQALIAAGDRVLVALSGGPDSVALLHMLHRLSGEMAFEVGTVHIHHGLRGADADADAAFCRQLAEELNLPHEAYIVDVPAKADASGESFELVGRRVRYGIYEELVAEAGYTLVATGHHLDDSVETFFSHLLRGAGPGGLTGIPAVRGVYRRPLLVLTRQEILDYLEGEELAYRVDATNADTAYRRNALRHELLPVVEGISPAYRQIIGRTTEMLAEEAAYFRELVGDLSENHIEASGDGYRVDREAFATQAPIVRQYWIRHIHERISGHTRDLGHAHIMAIRRLFEESQPGREIAIEGVRYRVKQSGLHVGRDERPSGLASDRPSLVVENMDKPANLIPDHSLEAYLDADRISGELVLRTRRPGDRFVPLGMSGEKKLKDFFIDDQIWLLCDSLHILWVVGYRIDDRVKVSPSTKRVLRIEVKRLVE
jgi:tRNA(Ile)-lysidine synthase